MYVLTLCYTPCGFGVTRIEPLSSPACRKGDQWRQVGDCLPGLYHQRWKSKTKEPPRATREVARPSRNSERHLHHHHQSYSVFKVSGNGRERRSHTSNFWHISVPTSRIGVAKCSRMSVPTSNFLYFNHWSYSINNFQKITRFTNRLWRYIATCADVP